MEKIAENEAVGEFNNMGIGIGTMAGVGGAVGNMIGGMMTETVKSTTTTQSNNKQTGNFCENCGNANKYCTQTNKRDIVFFCICIFVAVYSINIYSLILNIK